MGSGGSLGKILKLAISPLQGYSYYIVKNTLLAPIRLLLGILIFNLCLIIFALSSKNPIPPSLNDLIFISFALFLKYLPLSALCSLIALILSFHHRKGYRVLLVIFTFLSLGGILYFATTLNTMDGTPSVTGPEKTSILPKILYPAENTKHFIGKSWNSNKLESVLIIDRDGSHTLYPLLIPRDKSLYDEKGEVILSHSIQKSAYPESPEFLSFFLLIYEDFLESLEKSFKSNEMLFLVECGLIALGFLCLWPISRFSAWPIFNLVLMTVFSLSFLSLLHLSNQDFATDLFRWAGLERFRDLFIPGAFAIAGAIAITIDFLMMPFNTPEKPMPKPKKRGRRSRTDG